MQVSRELKRRLEDLGHSVCVHDILAFTPRWGRFLGWLYPWMVNHAPWLYEAIYRRFFLARQARAERASIPVRLATPGVARLLEREHPDLVVSTYHLAGVTAAGLRARGVLKAPSVTFITTFGVHDLWLHPGTDLYLCITSDVARRVSARTSAKVVVCEPVVRPEFMSPSPPGDDAGLPERPRTALVVAGSLGLGPIKEAVEAIAARPGWRPVAVCGGNEGLRAELSRIPGVVSLGWVEDMASLMAAASVVVDNAGGSTAKEALALGRPLLTFRPISGHGRHDALMMAEAGLTEVVERREDLVDALERLGTPELREARIASGRGLYGVDPAPLLTDFCRKWRRAGIP